MENFSVENLNGRSTTCMGTQLPPSQMLVTLFSKIKLWKSDTRESQLGVDRFPNIKIFLDQVIDTQSTQSSKIQSSH